MRRIVSLTASSFVARRVSSLSSRALLVVALLACISSAQADAPLPAPSVVRVTSPNGAFAATSHPKAGTWISRTTTGERVWQIPGWFRALYVSNDGHVATLYGGLDLVSLDAPDSLELITFWTDGKKLRAVTLGEIAPQRSVLERTTSHYAWGHIEGINDRNELIVRRADGQVLRFNMGTGRRK